MNIVIGSENVLVSFTSKSEYGGLYVVFLTKWSGSRVFRYLVLDILI
jgi:hypothetical protein